jgi:hypothetical protein
MYKLLVVKSYEYYYIIHSTIITTTATSVRMNERNKPNNQSIGPSS